MVKSQLHTCPIPRYPLRFSRFGSWLTLTFHFSSHAFEIFSRHKVAAGTVSESTSEPG